MKLRNFSLGINSYPASLPGSNHTTARDVLNLRVDGDGYLRLAPGVQDWHEFSSKVTGIAQAHDHLFFLLEGGDLYKLTRDDSDTPALVASTDMRGKLSVIDEFETFFLLTSEEADDPGYLYDVEGDELIALKLTQTSRPTTIQITDAEGDGGHEGHHVFFYLFTEVLVDDDETDEGQALGQLHAPVSAAYLAHQGLNSNITEETPYRVYFSGFTFNNPDTTHIYIYRSQPIVQRIADYIPDLTEADALEFFNKSNYFWVGQIERDTTTWADNNTGNQELTGEDPELPIRWQDEAEYSLDVVQELDGIPPNTRAWRHFNGYNFVATGGRMRYSDIRFGVLKHADFPESNSINAPGDTNFVETYNETLLFGDARHLHVLRGYDPFNFQVYQVASVGQVSAYAGNILPKGGFGFIAQDGFYVYDGETVKEISTPQLDRFFENKVAVDGTVIPLPNSESLWAVEFDDGAKFTFLLNIERLDAPIWTRQSFFFEQGAEFPLVPLGIWSLDDNGLWTFEDGGTWGYVNPEAEGIEQIFLVRNDEVVEQYLWHDLHSGNRADSEWLWESNLMRGGSETVKVYDRLKLAGYAENDINVDFELDIKGETVEKSISDASFAKNSRKKRILIKRRANSCSFKVSGTGEVELREVELDSRVVGRV